MERLTKRLADGTAYTGALINASIKGVTYPTYIGKAADKLAAYEDAEEQGLLLRLPCKEAYAQSRDCVYLVYDDEVIECTHCGLSINPVDGKAYIALAADECISEGFTLKSLLEAGEKQKAKRPDYEGDGYSDGHLVYDTWICPCCGKHYEVDYDDYDFCPTCGQCIDWRDEE